MTKKKTSFVLKVSFNQRNSTVKKELTSYYYTIIIIIIIIIIIGKDKQFFSSMISYMLPSRTCI